MPGGYIASEIILSSLNVTGDSFVVCCIEYINVSDKEDVFSHFKRLNTNKENAVRQDRTGRLSMGLRIQL